MFFQSDRLLATLLHQFTTCCILTVCNSDLSFYSAAALLRYPHLSHRIDLRISRYTVPGGESANEEEIIGSHNHDLPTSRLANSSIAECLIIKWKNNFPCLNPGRYEELPALPYSLNTSFTETFNFRKTVSSVSSVRF